MRIACGPTLAERAVLRKKRLGQWHRWFAWRPIRISPTQCVWLEFIQRKMRPNMSYGGPIWDKEYRLDPIEETLKEFNK